ncbi:hypothetical protein E2C01_064174 [Portunus trituberculatus]|uniref:Uncharacterized protein n=1 Tax=Portunus trituberculatus TaxID=210409 RepID=A0A5B7HB07_PORTR|nr:hypothetical protein [Portunus trituberculatus]
MSQSPQMTQNTPRKLNQSAALVTARGSSGAEAANWRCGKRSSRYQVVAVMVERINSCVSQPTSPQLLKIATRPRPTLALPCPNPSLVPTRALPPCPSPL